MVKSRRFKQKIRPTKGQKFLKTKGVKMTTLLKVFLLGFLALGFVACDKVSEVVDSASKAVDTATKEGKKFAKALSIEQPLLGVGFDDNYKQYLYIQSQDNNTIIEDIIINRGNCGVAKYKQDSDMAIAYRKLYPDRVDIFFSFRTKTKMVNLLQPMN